MREVYTALLDVASDKTTRDDKTLQNKVARWADEFERLKSPLLLADRLYTQKAAAMHAVTERDGQIVNLNQSMAEREGYISSLNQAATEREGQIANLNQAVTERDGRIASLNQAIAERDVYHQQTLNHFRSSTSWRLTSPLRYRDTLEMCCSYNPRLSIRDFHSSFMPEPMQSRVD